ncbi:universal stress protein [Streptomyces sp. NPDC005859]|uniref:universal stress protein n=1 Tax=Streptomyces sp. NPDC005859 TaxID=3157170 RepID=UPI0033C8743D
MLSPVVAAVDGSVESLAATAWAAREAERRDRPLHLLHAWDWHPRRQEREIAGAAQRHPAHHERGRGLVVHHRLQDLHVGVFVAPHLEHGDNGEALPTCAGRASPLAALRWGRDGREGMYIFLQAP